MRGNVLGNKPTISERACGRPLRADAKFQRRRKTPQEDISYTDISEIVLHGETAGQVRATQDIPYGFKICARAMAKGASVIKYSHPIGRAREDIAAGDLVHVHNIEGNRGRGDLAQ